MSKPRECFGAPPSEYTCRSKDCPYAAACCFVMQKEAPLDPVIADYELKRLRRTYRRRAGSERSV